jgi:LysM repeat protein
MGWAASDIADWWDEQHKLSKKAVDQFVDDNPNLFGVVVGTAVVTSMELGAGMVDALRFGQGAAEGGVGGYVKDGLRLIGLMGPLGKVAKYVRIARGARLSRLILDPGGGLCGWVSAAMAFTRTGTKLQGSSSIFTTVWDLANAVKQPVSALKVGFPFEALIKAMRLLGARIGPVQEISTLKELARLVRNDGSVVMVSLKNASGAGHDIVAFRDFLGRLRFLDRGGKVATLPQVFASLDEIAAKYRVSLTPQAAAVMDNVFVKVVDGIVELAMPVFFTTQAINESQNETIAQSFEVHRKIFQDGRKALETPQARHHSVVAGDWLSKLARTYYGDMHKWPVIYVANKQTIGGNPDLIKPGQRLLIPELPKVPKTGKMH